MGFSSGGAKAMISSHGKVYICDFGARYHRTHPYKGNLNRVIGYGTKEILQLLRNTQQVGTASGVQRNVASLYDNYIRTCIKIHDMEE